LNFDVGECFPIPSDRHETSDRSGRWDPVKILDIGLFGPPSAGRPFADNAQGGSEAARLQAAPKFSAVSATGCPLIVEPWQVLIERTLPGPEDIMAYATEHLSHKLPAMAGLARDLADRCSVLRQAARCCASLRQGEGPRGVRDPQRSIPEVAVEVVTSAEIRYREGRVRASEWRVRRRAQLEDEARDYELQMAREERESQQKLDKPGSTGCSMRQRRYAGRPNPRLCRGCENHRRKRRGFDVAGRG
jgi:hypothetical protein